MTEKQAKFTEVFRYDIARLIDGRYKMHEVVYSHTKKIFLQPFVYMWRHLPSGKSGSTTVWTNSASDLHLLCLGWNKQMPDKWKYLPLAFK